MNAECIPFPRKGTEKVPLIGIGLLGKGIGLLGKDELKASYKANGGKTTIQYKRRRTAYSSTSMGHRELAARGGGRGRQAGCP